MKPTYSRYKLFYTCLFYTALLALGRVPQAQAFEWYNITIPVSASLTVGSLKNTDYFLRTRTLNALSLEALPNYPLGNIRVGPHFEYSYQSQLRNVTSILETNLKGHVLTAGLGARSWLTNRIYAQIAIDIAGKYYLGQATEVGNRAYFKDLLAGYRLKLGYRFLNRVTRLTADFDASYLRFRKVENLVTEFSQTKQFMAGIGFTYRFGPWDPPAPKPVEKASPTPENVMEITIPDTSFELNSDILIPSSIPTLKAFAEVLRNAGQDQIQVEGFTDSSGTAEKNSALSQGRADAVKAYFIENGVDVALISAKGFGSLNPVASNATSEGRARNRRVQVRLVHAVSKANNEENSVEESRVPPPPVDQKSEEESP